MLTDERGCLSDEEDKKEGNPLDLSSPAAEWQRDAAGRALDELFTFARQYKSSKAYRDLLDFVARFRTYAPFNAMLLHIQMPGATFVATAHRWLRLYRRRVRANGRPLQILQPKGPVMFVFDVSDTEAEEGAPPLPAEVERPFEVRRGRVGGELAQTIENALRDGVCKLERMAGSQSAAEIRIAQPGRSLQFMIRALPTAEHVAVPLRYELLLNSQHSAEAKYASLVHELAHLYCGHLGTPNKKWWPDRRGLPKVVREFEAESVCYLVCERLGIDNPSAEYLSVYQRQQEETPEISLDRVMTATKLIQEMGRGRLKARKDRE